MGKKEGMEERQASGEEGEDGTGDIAASEKKRRRRMLSKPPRASASEEHRVAKYEKV